eukprot:TRINITY_DN3262_c0_g1_i3.p1 TRINITY_DN3262_c0_g1~~TRINITY_DN3262_c0_g1_i3.p1  ORF type:complete len:1201 (+),score=160.31 TRINITY_DN3262_c0_g1_i3:61-3663(+)
MSSCPAASPLPTLSPTTPAALRTPASDVCVLSPMTASDVRQRSVERMLFAAAPPSRADISGIGAAASRVSGSVADSSAATCSSDALRQRAQSSWRHPARRSSAVRSASCPLPQRRAVNTSASTRSLSPSRPRGQAYEEALRKAGPRLLQAEREMQKSAEADAQKQEQERRRVRGHYTAIGAGFASGSRRRSSSAPVAACNGATADSRPPPPPAATLIVPAARERCPTRPLWRRGGAGRREAPEHQTDGKPRIDAGRCGLARRRPRNVGAVRPELPSHPPGYRQPTAASTPAPAWSLTGIQLPPADARRDPGRPPSPASRRPPSPAAGRPSSPAAGRPPSPSRPPSPAADRPPSPASRRPPSPAAGRPSSPAAGRPPSPSRPPSPAADHPPSPAAGRPPSPASSTQAPFAVDSNCSADWQRGGADKTSVSAPDPSSGQRLSDCASDTTSVHVTEQRHLDDGKTDRLRALLASARAASARARAGERESVGCEHVDALGTRPSSDTTESSTGPHIAELADELVRKQRLPVDSVSGCTLPPAPAWVRPTSTEVPSEDSLLSTEATATPSKLNSTLSAPRLSPAQAAAAGRALWAALEQDAPSGSGSDIVPCSDREHSFRAECEDAATSPPDPDTTQSPGRALWAALAAEAASGAAAAAVAPEPAGGCETARSLWTSDDDAATFPPEPAGLGTMPADAPIEGPSTMPAPCCFSPEAEMDCTVSTIRSTVGSVCGRQEEVEETDVEQDVGAASQAAWDPTEDLIAKLRAAAAAGGCQAPLPAPRPAEVRGVPKKLIRHASFLAPIRKRGSSESLCSGDELCAGDELSPCASPWRRPRDGGSAESMTLSPTPLQLLADASHLSFTSSGRVCMRRRSTAGTAELQGKNELRLLASRWTVLLEWSRAAAARLRRRAVTAFYRRSCRRRLAVVWRLWCARTSRCRRVALKRLRRPTLRRFILQWRTRLHYARLEAAGRMVRDRFTAAAALAAWRRRTSQRVSVCVAVEWSDARVRRRCVQWWRCCSNALRQLRTAQTARALAKWREAAVVRATRRRSCVRRAATILTTWRAAAAADATRLARTRLLLHLWRRRADCRRARSCCDYRIMTHAMRAVRKAVMQVAARTTERAACLAAFRRRRLSSVWLRWAVATQKRRLRRAAGTIPDAAPSARRSIRRRSLSRASDAACERPHDAARRCTPLHTCGGASAP